MLDAMTSKGEVAASIPRVQLLEKFRFVLQSYEENHAQQTYLRLRLYFLYCPADAAGYFGQASFAK
jgi:hypothetical protein